MQKCATIRRAVDRDVVESGMEKRNIYSAWQVSNYGSKMPREFDGWRRTCKMKTSIPQSSTIIALKLSYNSPDPDFLVRRMWAWQRRKLAPNTTRPMTSPNLCHLHKIFRDSIVILFAYFVKMSGWKILRFCFQLYRMTNIFACIYQITLVNIYLWCG